MTVYELKEGLKEIMNILNPEINYSFEEVLNTIKMVYKDKTPEYREFIMAAYIGFVVGREYGFELGKNFIFNYVPENDY